MGLVKGIGAGLIGAAIVVGVAALVVGAGAPLSSLAPDRRAVLLESDGTKELPRSQVTEVTPEQFVNARDRELGFRTVMADLDGDGRPETIKGLIDLWNLADVEVFVGTGASVAKISPYLWAHKVIPVRLQPSDVTVFLEWRLYKGLTEVGVRWLMFSDGTWQWRRLSGWGLKHAETTRATRAGLSQDGILTVEWDIDPSHF